LLVAQAAERIRAIVVPKHSEAPSGNTLLGLGFISILGVQQNFTAHGGSRPRHSAVGTIQDGIIRTLHLWRPSTPLQKAASHNAPAMMGFTVALHRPPEEPRRVLRHSFRSEGSAKL
jgi:hypothetical protein